MENYLCPSCDAKTISFWQKQFSGALRRLKCSSCGVAVSVPWLHNLMLNLLGSVAVLLFGVGALVLVGEFHSLLSMLGVFLIGATLPLFPIAWLIHHYVPLITKKA